MHHTMKHMRNHTNVLHISQICANMEPCAQIIGKCDHMWWIQPVALIIKHLWVKPSHMVAFANNLNTWHHICANLRYLKQIRMISHRFRDINHGVLNLHKNDLNWFTSSLPHYLAHALVVTGRFWKQVLWRQHLSTPCCVQALDALPVVAMRDCSSTHWCELM